MIWYRQYRWEIFKNMINETVWHGKIAGRDGMIRIINSLQKMTWKMKIKKVKALEKVDCTEKECWKMN